MNILDETTAATKYMVVDSRPKQSTSDVATMAPSHSPDQEETKSAVDTNILTYNDSTNLPQNGTFPYDLTPKHHIRSPIIEETESGVEAEGLRSRGNLLSSSFNG